MMQRHNPDVSSFLEQEVLTHKNAEINFRDKQLKLAFGFEGFLDKELKDDERFVKTYVRMVYKKNGVQNETMIPHRRCRAEDFDLFAPSGPSSLGLLKMYKEGERNLYCLDWDLVGDDVVIRGDPNDEISYQRLEYLLTPCNYLHAEFGPTNDTIPKACNSSRQAQMDYLGNMRMVVFTDEQLF